MGNSSWMKRPSNKTHRTANRAPPMKEKSFFDQKQKTVTETVTMAVRMAACNTAVAS